MWKTLKELKEKGLEFYNAEDISQGIHFLERMKMLQDTANEFGVDLTKFRAKDINKFDERKYSMIIEGATLMALVRRGYLTKVSQETEKVLIDDVVQGYKFTVNGVEKTVDNYWAIPSEPKPNSKWTQKVDHETVYGTMEVNARYNVYALNQEAIDLTKQVIVDLVQAL